ncbi:MAG TPA: 3-oxoacyl-ACP synthase III [Planctomycetaceae bacterium]|jgi:3-oxoacyl-[acyl-carrier-protein] synthase-3|nr:3-oxoacyl-ACP synthase III [Planctomycetaceae bacterium]
MRYRHVSIAAVCHLLPPEIVTSAEIEARLGPVYQRLGLPEGRLELMTGIRERRFFPRGTRPGQMSAQVAARAIEMSQIDRSHFGGLVHGSVCRDQLEPATASFVHHAAGLPQSALVLDLSNACLGLLNGMVLLADMIELGQIRAGLVVGTEDGRALVEGTIDSLLANDSLTRQDVKQDFASLTIGSGSAAIVLCDRKLCRGEHRLLGGAFRAETASHELCTGGDSDKQPGDTLRMQTDSEALLHAGIALAATTWQDTKSALGWSNNDVQKAFTHQVGRAHRKLLFERLELDPTIDSPTVEYLGNTGAVALPTAWSIGIEQGRIVDGDHVALLGIGSGLNALMLGIEW